MTLCLGSERVNHPRWEALGCFVVSSGRKRVQSHVNFPASPGRLIQSRESARTSISLREQHREYSGSCLDNLPCHSLGTAAICGLVFPVEKSYMTRSFIASIYVNYKIYLDY